MEHMDTFHKTVRGYLHIMKGISCEDSSASLSVDGKYHIAVIADGHGDPLCFRSDIGSRIAVDTALSCLQEFAETVVTSPEVENRFYRDMFSNPRYSQMTLRQLTDTILAKWNDGILKDYKENLPSPEELLEGVGTGSRIAHIYGTTCLAALMLPSCLLLLHQGDGRCDVFFSDGIIEQPIPWDIRCEDTATTSMCDEDAAESFRTHVIDTAKREVIACYLGCDGVEDAYRDTYEELGGSHILMGGVHTFYKDLTCQLATKSKEEFQEYLEEMLPEFSQNGRFSRSGSGDDVSIAGIVNIEAVQQFTEVFQQDVKRYALEEALFWKEDELRSKERKHGILKKKVEEAKVLLAKAVKEQQCLQKQLEEQKEERVKLAEKVVQAKQELEEDRRESEDVMGYFQGTKKEVSKDAEKIIRTMIKKGAQQMIDMIAFLSDTFSTGSKKKEEEYNLLCEKLQDLDNEISDISRQYSDHNSNIAFLKRNLEEAVMIFSDYDAKYQKIYEEKVHIEEEIASL